MSEQTHPSEETRAAMEQMSTSRLEELLLQDFRAPEGGAQNMAALYQAAQVLASRKPCPSFAAGRAWESFQKNYLPFAQSAPPYRAYDDGGKPSSDAADARRPAPWRGRALRTAIAAAALALTLFSLCVAAAASGFNLWRHLARWTDEIMELTPPQAVTAVEDHIRIPEDSKEYGTIQEAVTDFGLARPVVPQWLPDGFQQVELVVDTGFPSLIIFQAAYQMDEDVIIVFVSIHLPKEDGSFGNYGHFQKDAGDPIPYESGGITHLLSTNAGRSVALWANGPAECAVSGDITMEELQKIIDSIY
ncbi:MAG: DUF4367 domain-containing protein [Oscillospiraceae bacterium]|nr:DUF4367 domain-containing protein [Oscillospiraceae bacterium]